MPTLRIIEVGDADDQQNVTDITAFPDYAELRTMLEDPTHWPERVRVLYSSDNVPKYHEATMFVDDCGQMVGMPVNPVATTIYNNNARLNPGLVSGHKKRMEEMADFVIYLGDPNDPKIHGRAILIDGIFEPIALEDYA